MVATMTHLEAREQIIAKINKRREEIVRPPLQQAPRERTSPALHYHISKYARSSYDMTAWLSELTGDPAIIVSSFDVLKIILLTECSELHTTPQRPFIGSNSRH
jgi:hypothetical protein